LATPPPWKTIEPGPEQETVNGTPVRRRLNLCNDD
jgi:hypothetical protein